MIDKHLKEVQDKLGLGISLATHCARRSVARRHSTELQRSTDALQTVFSHSDIKVTKGYIGTEQNITKSINESKVLFEDFPNVKLS